MDVRKDILFRNILVFAIVLYLGRAYALILGAILPQIALIIIILISSYYWMKLILKERVDFIVKVLSLFLILNTIGYILGDKILQSTQGYLRSVNTIDMYKGILIGITPFFPFYYFGEKKMISRKFLEILFFFLFFLFVANFYFYDLQKLLQYGEDSNITNNVGYSFVSLLPFLLILRNRKFLTLLSGVIILFFILSSVKRGAILVGLVSIFIFFVFLFKKSSKKYILLNYFLLFITIVIFIYFLNTFYESNDYLQSRIQDTVDGKNESRAYAYAKMFEYWIDSDSFINLLFGFGFVSSFIIWGDYAHNDWLELLTNFGVIGVMLYLPFFIYVYKSAFSKGIRMEHKFMLLMLITAWLLRSIFSMGYTNLETCITSLLLGTVLGIVNFEKKQKLKM